MMALPTQPQTWTQLIRLLSTVHFTQFAPNSTFPINILIEMSLLQVYNNHVKKYLKNNLNWWRNAILGLFFQTFFTSEKVGKVVTFCAFFRAKKLKTKKSCFFDFFRPRSVRFSEKVPKKSRQLFFFARA